LIAIAIGEIVGEKCIIDTWLMSCRVLKRDMEFAMLDQLVKECKKRQIKEIIGVYKRTAKNNMVANLYAEFGFELLESSNTEDATSWRLQLNDYKPKEITIKTN
jgi:predicted enzyme involved in methoxymalonyl-ACP biosynthesis